MSTIVRLFFDSRPAAIPRGVWAIIVDAIKLMVRRWFSSHLGKKLGIVIKLKFNATSPVVFPILVIWIIAALTGAVPSFPFWSRFIAFPIAVLGVLATNGGVFGAATRLSGSALQVIALDGMVIAAVATAKPMGVPAFGMGKGDDCQKVKSLADKIDDLVLTFRHPFTMPIGYSYVNAI